MISDTNFEHHWNREKDSGIKMYEPQGHIEHTFFGNHDD